MLFFDLNNNKTKKIKYEILWYKYIDSTKFKSPNIENPFANLNQNYANFNFAKTGSKLKF